MFKEGDIVLFKYLGIDHRSIVTRVVAEETSRPANDLGGYANPIIYVQVFSIPSGSVLNAYEDVYAFCAELKLII